MTFVYLLHFVTPLHHAAHYVGATHDLKKRLERHVSGHGSRLLRAMNEKKYNWELARVWTINERITPGNFQFVLEKTVKMQKQGGRFCPYCRTEPASIIKEGVTEIDLELLVGKVLFTNLEGK